MRKFNSFEKDIIKKLVNSYNPQNSTNIYSFFIENILINRLINFEGCSDKLFIFHYNNNVDKNSPSEFINFFSLFEYLDNNGLISITENQFLDLSNKKQLSQNLIIDEKHRIRLINGKGNKNLPNISMTFPKGYYSKLVSLNKKDVWITNDLFELVENNFESLEMKVYKQSIYQRNISIVVLGLSIGTFLFSIWIFKNDDKPIEIENYQIESIINPLEEIGTKLDTLNKIYMREEIKNVN